jgi:hypothetical protein
MTAREELLQELEELVPDYVGADYLREAESWLEELIDLHGEHPLLRATIKKISRRIIAIELGECAKEK